MTRATPVPDVSGDYDLPPLPPPPEGTTPDVRYHGQLLEWQTRSLDGRLRHGAARATVERAQVTAALGELRAEVRDLGGKVDGLDESRKPGAIVAVLAAIARLPTPVQLSLAATVGPLLAAVVYQASGAAIEHWTGSPPPQVTVPVAVSP